MNAHDILLAMLPEHLLLAGILLLIVFEIVSLEVRSVVALAVQAIVPWPVFNTPIVCGGTDAPPATPVNNRPLWLSRMV